MSGQGVSLSLHTIVLAAGASTRFGSPKQLARFQGRTLIERVLAAASEVTAATITVVVGAHAADVVRALPAGRAGVLVNREWQEGMASSLRTAVRALPGACDGVLILLADQPLINAAGLNRLASTWRRRPKRIIASRYEGVTGVPAIFPRWCFTELCELRGDQGARALFMRHADHVTRIDHPEAGVDIDQPEDLLSLT